MKKNYDLVIVGAGPGGAMAAKVAGENGLKTAILERKTNPAEIRRACGMMFAIESGYYFAERMYYNEKNQKMVFPVNGFTIDYEGPTRNFYAWHFHAPDGKARIEFGDYEENIKKADRGRLSLVYDKGKLIEDLIKDAVKNDVDLFTGINIDGIEKIAKGVKVTGNGETFVGDFLIGADGINSRIADLMGFNKKRTSYGPAQGMKYYVTGLNIPQSEAANTAIFFKQGISKPAFFWILPSPYAEGEYQITVRTQEDFEYATKKSHFSPWFNDIKVTRVLCFAFNPRSPVSEPYKENVLLVGDSAWFGEAEITGSMMCGWKAANAVTVALKDNKLDREGVINYIEWWKKSFPEFDDYRNFMLLMPFRLIFSEQEINYLYSLFKQPLRSTLNPFLVVKLVKQALEPMMSQISKEMPSVIPKLKMLEANNIEKILLDMKKKTLLQ